MRIYVSYILNGCIEFKNFYSRRHDRIVDKLFHELKSIFQTKSLFTNKLFETVFPQFREGFKNIVHRKPDIVVFHNDICYIIEITVCYDTYMDYAFNEKVNRYRTLVEFLNMHGIGAKLLVMCFGSLGCIKSDVRNNLRMLGFDIDDIKSFLSWTSISCIIGANYIWRHRVKKLFNK